MSMVGIYVAKPGGVKLTTSRKGTVYSSNDGAGARRVEVCKEVWGCNHVCHDTIVISKKERPRRRKHT